MINNGEELLDEEYLIDGNGVFIGVSISLAEMSWSRVRSSMVVSS